MVLINSFIILDKFRAIYLSENTNIKKIKIERLTTSLKFLLEFIILFPIFFKFI